MEAALACALASALSAGGLATAPAEMNDELQKEIERLRDRMESLERQHEADQERIRRFEEQLEQMSEHREPGWIDEQRAEEQCRLVEGVLADADVRAATMNGAGQGNLLNPQVTAFVDFGFSLSSSDDPEYNRFNLREIELDFRAAVTPWADGVVILAFPEEIETTESGGTETSIEFEVEEAYLNFHTIPGDLALKGGKFRNAFGVNNLLHTHDLPQVDRPLVVRAFFGEEGLSTIGASGSWLVPNPWDKYVELMAELVNADGGEEGAPVLGGPGPADPAFLARLMFFDDLGEYGSLQLGSSYLYSQGADRGASDLSTLGLDATIKWLDPEAPDQRSVLVQAEFLWNSEDIAGVSAFDGDSFGFYAFGQYQFSQRWYGGVRFDYTEFPSLAERFPGDEEWAISPYLTWYLAEFLRFRVQYQHVESMVAGSWHADDNFLFAVSFSIGAHPSHPFWVNR